MVDAYQRFHDDALYKSTFYLLTYFYGLIIPGRGQWFQFYILRVLFWGTLPKD